MKTGKAIKLTLFTASILSALYHAPQIIEMTEQVKAVGTMGGLNGGEGNAFDMLRQLQGAGQMSGGLEQQANSEPELQVFSPEYGSLSDAEKAELLAAAQRMRPRIERDPNGNPTANTPDGSSTGTNSEPNRITIGGVDPSILKQLEQLGGAEEVLKQLGGAPK